MNAAAGNDSEARIERVLGGLRVAQAPEGMESRVLRRLAERAAVGVAAPWLRRLSGPVLGWGLGVAGVIALALVVAGVHRPVKQVLHRGAEVRRAVAPTVPGVGGDAIGLTPHTVSVPRGVAAGLGSRPMEKIASAAESATELSRADGSDAVAMSEVMAPSLAAPPMPLTDQERLMLDILHRGDPVQMAMLNPDERAARDAVERAEVQSFFVKPSPTVLEQRTLEQTETNKGERR